MVLWIIAISLIIIAINTAYIAKDSFYYDYHEELKDIVKQLEKLSKKK